jgi:hypothetical protein
VGVRPDHKMKTWHRRAMQNLGGGVQTADAGNQP